MSDPKRKLLTDYHGEQIPGVETLAVELWYPGQPDVVPGVIDRARYVEVGMVCVRATDDVRVSYSHDRNGWVIEQPYTRTVEHEDHDEEVEFWRETAFCPSWALRDYAPEEAPIELVVPPDDHPGDPVVDPFTEHMSQKLVEDVLAEADRLLLEGER